MEKIILKLILLFVVSISTSKINLATNLIANGDFSGGNVGFTSQYFYCNTAGCLGACGCPPSYAVGTDANYYHSFLTGHDHTTGSGNFLIADGGPAPTLYVWRETVPVIPNTNYSFSFWLSSVFPSSPANIQVVINGVNVGSPFIAPGTVNTWIPYNAIWNSGLNTSATIDIIDLNSVFVGNDFGLDDIDFNCTNLIANGDFSGGNVGFTNQYFYCNTAGCLGACGCPPSYAVGTDANYYHGFLTGHDHTTGSGNFLIADGGPAPTLYVWRETVPVIPNTNYSFSFWLSSVFPSSPANIQVVINGVNIGSPIIAPGTVNTWIPYNTSWNSGLNTSATIDIIDLNTTFVGNDFGLDDISFCSSNCPCNITGPSSLIVGTVGVYHGLDTGGYWKLSNYLPCNASIVGSVSDDSVIVNAGAVGGTFDLWYEVCGTTSCYLRVRVDNPLPIELTAFTSTINNRNVRLNWTTAEEQNNSGFEIERSMVNSQWSPKGVLWTMISNVAGHGTTNIPHNYTFTDRNLTSGRYNYRLKQIDYNGNFRYYDLQNEVVIGTPEKFTLHQNYPNPFNPVTKINYDIPIDGNVTIKVFDVNGKEVATIVNEFKPAGYWTAEFNGINFSSGAYFYQLQSGDFVEVKRMVLLK